MSDDTLRRVLKNALGARKAPEELHARVFARLRRRGYFPWIAAAAMVALAAGVVLFVSGEAPLPETVAEMIEKHRKHEVSGTAPASMSPDEVKFNISKATDRQVEMSPLKDAGFSGYEAHKCADLDCAHVVYHNHWLTMSCFIAPAGEIDLTGGERSSHEGVEVTAFTRENTSAVAIREGGVTKLWVADLRPGQLAKIAVDAEQKRHLVKKTVYRVAHHPCVARPMEAILMKTPGIEHVQMDEKTEQAQIWYDKRRVSPDQILGMLIFNGIEAHPMPSGD